MFKATFVESEALKIVSSPSLVKVISVCLITFVLSLQPIKNKLKDRVISKLIRLKNILFIGRFGFVNKHKIQSY